MSCHYHVSSWSVLFYESNQLLPFNFADKLMAERRELTESLNQVEGDLADRETQIDSLESALDDQRKNLEEKIQRLTEENDDMNRNILEISSAKKEAMDKIRGLEEEVSDADGAIDDAKAASELLDSKMQ